jgi:signal peptidase I
MTGKGTTDASEQPKKSGQAVFQEYAEALVIAVILAIIIRAFFVQAFKIPSSSMEPTLLVGDHILVNKFIYGVRIPFTDKRWPQFKSPQRGDVIVFVYPEDRSKDYIKRIVAVPGDTIEVRRGKVVLNGAEISESYAHHFGTKGAPSGFDIANNMAPLKVPPGKLFVMGDNRDNSQDSRFWGFVPIEDVKGEAFMIYFSWYDPIDALHRGYIGRLDAKTFKLSDVRALRWGRLFNFIH